MCGRTVLVILALVAAVQSVRAEMIPTIAMPSGWDPLQHREIVACVDALLARSHFGKGTEQAAFIVLTEKREFACVPWRTHETTSHSARYRGRIPQGTVAIAHTHPASSPEPSRQDQREADRVDVPFLVVSAENVVVVRPGHSTASSEPSRSRLSALSRR
jgi:proteasome lid subunit RPN8/RPN11